MARKTITSIRPPKVRKFSQELSCDLNALEYEKTAERLAAKISDLAKLEDEKKRVVKDFAERITVVGREQEQLRKNVETHTEPRQVACEESFDFATNRVTVTRTDTGEVVNERAMEQWERAEMAQDDLPMRSPEQDQAEG